MARNSDWFGSKPWKWLITNNVPDDNWEYAGKVSENESHFLAGEMDTYVEATDEAVRFVPALEGMAISGYTLHKEPDIGVPGKKAPLAFHIFVEKYPDSSVDGEIKKWHEIGKWRKLVSGNVPGEGWNYVDMITGPAHAVKSLMESYIALNGESMLFVPFTGNKVLSCLDSTATSMMVFRKKNAETKPEGNLEEKAKEEPAGEVDFGNIVDFEELLLGD